MKGMYDKRMECPICMSPYQTKKILSRFVRVASLDTDFYSVYEYTHLNPLLYHVNICPNCGYSHTEDFSPYFPPNAKEQIAQKVCQAWTQQDYGNERSVLKAINAYKLALYCALLKKEKHVTIAGLLLRIAWLHRLEQREEEEKRFLLHSLNEYKLSYETDDFQSSKMTITKVLYLIGELNRRVGQEHEASYYFSQIIQRHSKAGDPKIIEMARDRYQEIREKQKQEAEVI